MQLDENDTERILAAAGDQIWRSMQRNLGSPEVDEPRCACCRRNGWMTKLHRDVGSGGPFRCDNQDCMVF